MAGVELILASLAIFVGAAVQGSIGFGLGMVAAPILMFVDTRLVPGPMFVVSFLFTQLVVFRERGDVNLRDVGFTSVGRLVGVAPAALIFPMLSRSSFDLLFGSMILIGVGLSLWRRAPALTPTNLAIAGSVSGFMNTISAVGGPPMALVFQGAAGPHVRSTLGMFVMIGALISMVALFLVGEFGWLDIRLGLILTPAAILGFLFSGLLVGRVDRQGTRAYLLALSFAAGLAVLIRGLLS